MKQAVQFPILDLCARLQQHPVQLERLAESCAVFSRWDSLLWLAEKQGMAPLLHRNLTAIDVDIPKTFLRDLRFLRHRHQRANTLLVHSLHNILDLLNSEGIPVLVLKGAALCLTLYPKVGLRPMRDIDLLLAKEDVVQAQLLLRQHGFVESTVPIPRDHFHLPPLHRQVNDLRVCVELHHDLFPDCPPYYEQLDFAKLYRNHHAFDVHGTTAYTLGIGDMLQHLYQHGFHAPLTYEPYRLISAADIISLVEAKVEEIDWQMIQSTSPQLFNALPLLHSITPWNDTVLKKVLFEEGGIPSRAGKRFVGWPQLRLSEQKKRGKGFIRILCDTFLPGRWWLRIYYTPVGRFSYYWCKFVRHPKHIFWWMKIYGSIFCEVNLPVVDGCTGKKTFVNVLKHIRVLTVAMFKKL